MRRTSSWTLILILLVAAGALAVTVATGTTPNLGLDLQGGASVVLQPKSKAKSGTLDQAIEIIRSRVDALGVAEPDISRQGGSIIVQLPGVKNQKRALQIVGQTAQLLFRPVLGTLPPESTTPTTAPAPGAPTTVPSAASVPTTPREQDDPTKPVILPEKDKNGRVSQRYELGPAELKGSALSGATATIQPQTGQWQVDFTLSGKGWKDFDALAAR